MIAVLRCFLRRTYQLMSCPRSRIETASCRFQARTVRNTRLDSSFNLFVRRIPLDHCPTDSCPFSDREPIRRDPSDDHRRTCLVRRNSREFDPRYRVRNRSRLSDREYWPITEGYHSTHSVGNNWSSQERLSSARSSRRGFWSRAYIFVGSDYVTTNCRVLYIPDSEISSGTSIEGKRGQWRDARLAGGSGGRRRRYRPTVTLCLFSSRLPISLRP